MPSNRSGQKGRESSKKDERGSPKKNERNGSQKDGRQDNAASSSQPPRQRSGRSAGTAPRNVSSSSSDRSQRYLQTAGGSRESQAAAELHRRLGQDCAQQTATSGWEQSGSPIVEVSCSRPAGKGGARSRGGRSLGGAKPLLSEAQRIVDQRSGQQGLERSTSNLNVQVFDVVGDGVLRSAGTASIAASYFPSAVTAVADSVKKGTYGNPLFDFSPAALQDTRAGSGESRATGGRSATSQSQTGPSSGPIDIPFPPPGNLPLLPPPNLLPPLPQSTFYPRSPTPNFAPHPDLPPPRAGPDPSSQQITESFIGDLNFQTERLNQMIALQSEAQKCHLEATRAFVRMEQRALSNESSRYEDRDALNVLLRSVTSAARIINQYPDLAVSPNGDVLSGILSGQLPAMMEILKPELIMRQTYVGTMTSLVNGVRRILDALAERSEKKPERPNPANLPYAFRVLRRKLNQKMPILRLEMGICLQDVQPLMECIKEISALNDPRGRSEAQCLRPWLENALRAQQVVRNIDKEVMRFDELGKKIGGDAWMTAEIGLGASEGEIDAGGDFRGLSGLLDAMGINPRVPQRR